MERHDEHCRRSGSFWAYVLIILGILWILDKGGPDIFGGLFSGIGHFFGSLFNWAAGVTFPLLLLLAVIILIAGRRFFGALLFVLLLLILIPGFLVIPGIIMIILFPVILIVTGIVILTKLF